MLADGFDVETGEPATWWWGNQDRVLSNFPNQQCLRKSFGTHLVMAGVELAIVSKLLRHTNPALRCSCT
jgi:hypothetical protein